MFLIAKIECLRNTWGKIQLRVGSYLDKIIKYCISNALVIKR